MNTFLFWNFGQPAYNFRKYQQYIFTKIKNIKSARFIKNTISF